MYEITSSVFRHNKYDVSEPWDFQVSCKCKGHSSRDELTGMIEGVDKGLMRGMLGQLVSGSFGNILSERIYEDARGKEWYADGSDERLRYGVFDTVILQAVVYPAVAYNNDGELILI